MSKVPGTQWRHYKHGEVYFILLEGWEQENKIYGINKEITTWELTQAIALGHEKYLQDSLTDSFVDAIQAKYSEAS